MLVNTSNNLITAITTILASIGAINWGLVGALNFNLVTYCFGEYSSITNTVYVLVGISGLYLLFGLSKVLSTPSVKDVV